MVTGILKQWRTGCWMVYDKNLQLNHYLDDSSTVEIETSPGKWVRVEFEPGPGGFILTVNKSRIEELMPARLIETNDKILNFNRIRT